jgi:hypothetical protein
MHIIRRTQITLETKRILVMRQPLCNSLGWPPDWCAICGTPAVWLDLAQAAAWGGVPLTQIQSWLATGGLHGVPIPADAPLICFNSFLQFEANYISTNQTVRRSEP